jgi:predicted nucleic acid-binding protein
VAILIDTNILLRSIQTQHPHYAMVERAFAILRATNETFHVAAQNFIEFWSVATRPAGSENGLGMTTDEVLVELSALKELFPVLSEPQALFEEWERLVTKYRVSGKNTHDARLVAVMNLHGIRKILTFNVQDFTRYDNIETLHPQSV